MTRKILNFWAFKKLPFALIQYAKIYGHQISILVHPNYINMKYIWPVES